MSNLYYVAGIQFSDGLYHHGIKGQKWGVRRFQNADGTLTKEGQLRYRRRLLSGKKLYDQGQTKKSITKKTIRSIAIGATIAAGMLALSTPQTVAAVPYLAAKVGLMTKYGAEFAAWSLAESGAATTISGITGLSSLTGGLLSGVGSAAKGRKKIKNLDLYKKNKQKLGM